MRFLAYFLSFVGFVVGVQFQQMKTCIFTFVGLGSPFFFQQMKAKSALKAPFYGLFFICGLKFDFNK